MNIIVIHLIKNRKLRTGFGGLLRMNPIFKEYGLRDLLPLKLDIPGEGCTRPNDNMYCFEAGKYYTYANLRFKISKI